ncbi:hypothetical protein FHR90_002373 [Endobacter medicaginis]|jgi:Protein of unknown function (DUF3035)|uniref:DUF3035 domain-containing protein n=1 Tax=Endobacter medicaginis TaxID=1181271 RepID=A0A839V4S2_9PROT|nr:DUF3035 domain-containing protein [Endobacter medicaginis]MBB3174532.1 hypothetical protein [Endobacter medicaginis]MCX5476452.1 DUF3035 domain-containing protein [Endobacter medicaginis]NVN29651.1 DUF3035 domain-containing protein [Endobacter medicaginis]
MNAARLTVLSLAATALCGLSACSGEQLERSFGLSRNSPDEFAVTTQPPLSLPPSERLPTPTPGAPRPQLADQRNQALETLAPDVAIKGDAAASSPGQQAMLAQAGTPDPSLGRAGVNGELDSPDRSFVDGIMFWKPPVGQNPLVDAPKESKRLQGAAQQGVSPTSGATPVQPAPKKSSFLGLF